MRYFPATMAPTSSTSLTIAGNATPCHDPPMRTWLVVPLLVAACSHGASKSTTPVAAGPSASCEQTSQHVVALLPARDASNADLQKSIEGIFRDHCTTDGWTAEARQCLMDSKELKDADACKGKLTQAQVDSFGKAFDAAFPTTSDQGAAAGSTPVTEAAPPPPPPKSTRGPAVKPKGGGSGKNSKTGDPCEGGQ